MICCGYKIITQSYQDMLALLMYCATDKFVYSATRVVYSATSQLFRVRIHLRQADVLTYLLPTPSQGSFIINITSSFPPPHPGRRRDPRAGARGSAPRRLRLRRTRCRAGVAERGG